MQHIPLKETKAKACKETASPPYLAYLLDDTRTASSNTRVPSPRSDNPASITTNPCHEMSGQFGWNVGFPPAPVMPLNTLIGPVGWNLDGAGLARPAPPYPLFEYSPSAPKIGDTP